MKIDNHFENFLSKDVNLNQTRLVNLNEKAKNVSNFLSNNLDGFVSITKQGSYALGTIIKPVRAKQEYDVDMLVFMECEICEPASYYVDSLYDTLQAGSYKNISSKGTRCVKLNYARDFHMDLVPCIKINGEYNICNRTTDDFEMSDGTGYQNWFLSQNSLTNGNLKRVVKLLKFLKSHRTNFTAKSILLTTLAGNQITSTSADLCQTVPEALLNISTGIRDFLQEHDQVPTICNPALPKETFNRHWDQNKFNNFKEKFCNIVEIIIEAYNESDNTKSLDKWRKLFGQQFGSSTDNSTTTTKNISAGIFSSPPKPYLSSW